MSLAITIVTTANRSRRFFQTEPAHVAGILDSLKRCGQLFSSPSLIIVSDTATEVFNPKSIARLEIETQIDLAPYLPPPWDLSILAIDPDALTGEGYVDNENLSTRVDFFFEGGATLAAWAEGPQPVGTMERTARITRIFEQPVIPYRPLKPGIGFINPAAMTRARIGVAADHPPAGCWYANEA